MGIASLRSSCGGSAVACGLIGSLNRPEGNVTGIVSRQVELAGKRLELLKEALPGVSSVAVISDRAARRAPPDLDAAAAQLELRLQPLRIEGKRELDIAFERARQDATAALLVFSVGFHEQRGRIAKLALDARLPIMAPERDFVVAGALMSYAPDRDGVMKRVAYFIDRLLHGAKVQELPVERAANFKLSINLKTAKALGVQLPESILLRADEVIR